MVGDFIYKMKTTFEFNFDLHIKLLNSMDTQKQGKREKLLIKSFFLIACKHGIQRKAC